MQKLVNKINNDKVHGTQTVARILGILSDDDSKDKAS